MIDCKCVKRDFINLYFSNLELIYLLKETNVSIQGIYYTIKIKF